MCSRNDAFFKHNAQVVKYEPNHLGSLSEIFIAFQRIWWGGAGRKLETWWGSYTPPNGQLYSDVGFTTFFRTQQHFSRSQVRRRATRSSSRLHSTMTVASITGNDCNTCRRCDPASEPLFDCEKQSQPKKNDHRTNHFLG
jgi:hypothetical protein